MSLWHGAIGIDEGVTGSDLQIKLRTWNAQTLRHNWEKPMTRTVVKTVTMFALVIGATLAMSNDNNAEAGPRIKAAIAKMLGRGCGNSGGCGLFSGRSQSSCCAPEPSCCAPEPSCCAPEPSCCEAAPEPSCGCGDVVEAAPVVESTGCGCGDVVEAAPVMESTGCGCGGEVVSGGEMIVDGSYGGEVMSGEVMSEGSSDPGYNLAPGEVLVPGSVATVGTSEETVPAPAADEAADAPESASDEAAEEGAPPAPQPDATTDA